MSHALQEVERSASALPGPEAWTAYFGRHARTFRMAARLFPAEHARRVAGVYAYCRFTDDLVDDAPAALDPAALRHRLEAWRELSRRAFERGDTGVRLLDEVLGDAARSGVDWSYPEALLDGVAMDLEGTDYATWEELDRYTFAVAGSVGGWLCQLFAVREPEMLERAHALGHAMQLTNILRDVGEDLERGRVYLPLDLLEAHGFSAPALAWARAGRGPLPLSYGRAMEELIARAEERYEEAWPGIATLPSWFRRPVAAAAAAYRGIHREVRANGYDNLRMRAHTSVARKLGLSAAGLLRAWRAA